MTEIVIKPKISINPLIEYIGATEKRKKSIVKQQKEPLGFVIGRYRTARYAFGKYFKNGYDENILINAIDYLQTKEQKSDWTRDDSKKSIEALRCFLGLEFPFQNLKCRFLKPDIKRYDICGVDVIVSPDLLLEWENEGQKVVGAIKFYIKMEHLSLKNGRINASLLSDFLRHTLSENVEVSRQHCICIDIMNQRMFVAPENTKEDMELVVNACNEIRTKWFVA